MTEEQQANEGTDAHNQGVAGGRNELVLRPTYGREGESAADREA